MTQLNLMRYVRLITSVAVAVTVFSTVTGIAFADCQTGEVKIKFSHVTNANKHPKGIAAALLETRINEEMDGKACMEVFPNSTLFDDNKVLEAVLNGDIQLAAPSLSKFEKFTKKYRVFDLPFIFEDINAVDQFQNSKVGKDLKNVMVRKGLRGLAFWHNGMKQLSANIPLIKPSDANGLKFRVQSSDVLVAQFQHLGANPQKMAFKEVYGALQTKVIDGQENTWSNIYGKKFYEVQDGVTETNHGVIDYLVVTSTEWWEELEADVRDQFLEILHEVTENRNRESYNVDQRNKQRIIEAGGIVRELSADQREMWVSRLKPVWEKFKDDIGSEIILAAEAANSGN